jgi:hypothetical protein
MKDIRASILHKMTYVETFGYIVVDQLGPQPFDDEIPEHARFLSIQSTFDELSRISDYTR